MIQYLNPFLSTTKIRHNHAFFTNSERFSRMVIRCFLNLGLTLALLAPLASVLNRLPAVRPDWLANMTTDLIATRQPNRYNHSIIRLQDLHDYAKVHGELSHFSTRMNHQFEEHFRKTSFLERLRRYIFSNKDNDW